MGELPSNITINEGAVDDEEEAGDLQIGGGGGDSEEEGKADDLDIDNL